MLKTEVFDRHAAEYDTWFDMHPFVFRSEAEALRDFLPPGESHGIEIGLGTGRFAVELGIKEGIEPAAGMRELALTRGIEAMDATAERLPYKDLHFDFVLMASCISYIDDLHAAFREANRVLKHNGRLILGSIDKNSLLGRSYEARRQQSLFYRQATFFSIDKLIPRLKDAGFSRFEFSQTLFHPLEEIREIEHAKTGYGQGSFVIIKALKK